MKKHTTEKAMRNYYTRTRDVNLLAIISQNVYVTGLWCRDVRRPWFTIAITCFISNVVTQIIKISMVKDDVEFIECLNILTFCEMGMLKVTSLYINQDRWKELLTNIAILEENQMQSDKECLKYYSNYKENDSIVFSKYIERYVARFKFFSTALSRLYYFTIVIFIIMPFVEFFFRKHYLNENPDYPHILPGWTPFDENIYVYFITMTMELIGSVYCVVIHIAFDVMLAGVMIFVCGQFSLIRGYSDLIGRIYVHSDHATSFDSSVRYMIAKCHHYHILIISVVKLLKDLTKAILGVYYVVVCVTLCATAVRLDSMSPSPMQIISLLQCMITILTQFFVFSYYGQDLLNESGVGQAEGPFGAAWWHLSPRMRREILLLSMGMSQQQRLYAGFFHSLDLPSFVQILRAAYSFYAVICQK